MPKSQREYKERSRKGQYLIRRNIENRANQELAAARARENRLHERVDQHAPGGEVGEIVVHVQGEAEALNEAGRRAAQVAVENRPNSPPQQEDIDGMNQPPQHNGVEPRFDDEDPENPYDNVLSGDESEEEEPDRHNFFENQNLYEGAPITVGESMRMVLNLMLNHNLTGSCVADLLQLINFHCPAAGLHRLSYYKFRAFTSGGNAPMKKKHYCAVCFTSLRNKDEVCPTCRVDKEKGYFVQLPLINQLSELYKRPGFYNSLQHRHGRVREAGPNYVEDIYDGSVYQEQVRAGFLSNRFNISLTWYTDGAPVFNSKNYSIWPFSFMINELPYKMRVSRENVLLAGLWFGPHKPAVNMFLRSFLPDLRELYRGVPFHIADFGGNRVEIKAVVLAGVCDIPAKSSFLNFTSFSGFYGCSVCEIVGETLKRDGETDKHVYRYQEDLPLRSIADYENLAREAVESNQDAIRGVKGPTALHLFMPDFLKGAAIDPMHLISGVTKKLLKLHFSSTCSKEPFSLRAVLPVADRELLKIKPPKFIHRKAQSLQEYHRWKASQLDFWLNCYSIPIYQNIMPARYFHHYLKFVSAVSLLNSNKVSVPQIDKAERLLNEFVRDFEVLYGLKYASINIHLLLHLPDCVRRLGPLWVYSCYPMENLNGLMLATIHGKTSVDSQVCNSFWKVLCQERLLHEMPDGPKKEFMTKRRRSVKIQEQIGPGCYSVGNYSEIGAGDQHLIGIIRAEHADAENMSLYFRLLKDSMIYAAKRYERDLASDSSYVMYEHLGRLCYGYIEVFVRVQCNCGEPVNLCECVIGHYAVIHQVRLVDEFRIPYHPGSTLTHIRRYAEANNVIAVPVSRLKTVCVHMNIFDNMYIARPLNSHEVE